MMGKIIHDRVVRLALLVFLFVVSEGIESSKPVQVASLFSKDEEEYDRYAAAMAVLEPLRRERDSIIKECMNPIKRWWYEFRYGSVPSEVVLSDDSPRMAKAQKACNDYIIKSTRSITALNLDVPTFNQLSRTITQDRTLQRRIMQQAYLYRVVAEFNGDKYPALETFQEDEAGRKTEEAKRKAAAAARRERRRQRTLRFTRALQSIEELRISTKNDVTKELGLREFPPGLCDPDLTNVVNPKIKRACEEYPRQAEFIVKSYGFTIDEFNELLEKSRDNVIFQARINYHLNRLEAEAEHQNRKQHHHRDHDARRIS